MGKCLKCGKTVLGRKRKCKNCKVKKKPDDESELFIENNTYSSCNESNHKDIMNTEEENILENTLNDNFIQQLIHLDINEAPEFVAEEDQIALFEIDSLNITLNEYNIPHELGTLTIYTKPKIFNVKKKLYLKIGWIFFLKAGLQCNLLTDYTNEWKSIYNNTILNIEESFKKYFLQMLPINLDKVVFNEYIGEFLSSLVKVIGQDVFLYGKGLKCSINSQYIRNLLLCLSKNDNNKCRIDLAKSMYDHVDQKFDPETFKSFIDSQNNYQISKMRLFSHQFGECTSLVATIKQYDKIIGEFTCYYHNSIVYRKFFDKNKHTIPSILGKTISDRCNFDYISKKNYIELLNEFANNCIGQFLVRRIEFRLLNFENIEENINFFDLVLQNIDKFSTKLSNDFTLNYNIIYYYIKLYETNSLINDQILLEELMRIFFLGLDSEKTNCLIDKTTLKILLIDIRNKYRVYVNDHILEYNIDYAITDRLVLKRIYNSICKDKQLFAIIQYICAGYNNNGFNVAKVIIRKIFFKQLFIDFLQTCNTQCNDQSYCLKAINCANEFNIQLYLKVNNSLEYTDPILKKLSTLNDFMRQGILPPNSLIGECNTLRIRNREFCSKYSYIEYSKLILERFLNYNEPIHGFSNSQVIIQILYVLFNYINKYNWNNINDVFEQFCEYVSDFLFESNFKLFPLYIFTKMHTQNTYCFQWIKLYNDDKVDLEIDSLNLIFNNLDFNSNYEYFEPYEIYDDIINTKSNPLSCYRLPKLSNNVIFDNYIQKINSKFQKDVWENSIGINRNLISTNNVIYISILRFMSSDKIKNLSFKVTKKKSILALRYFMFVSGSIFMQGIGSLTKYIRKDEIIKILPIFEDKHSRNAILIIDEQKFHLFHDSITKLSN